MYIYLYFDKIIFDLIKTYYSFKRVIHDLIHHDICKTYCLICICKSKYRASNDNLGTNKVEVPQSQEIREFCECEAFSFMFA